MVQIAVVIQLTDLNEDILSDKKIQVYSPLTRDKPHKLHQQLLYERYGTITSVELLFIRHLT